MRKFLLLLLLGLTAFCNGIQAQSCTTINVGNDTTIPCTQACFTLHAKIPDVRSTENYVVNQIPYNPYPFVTTNPALSLACSNQDDKFFSTSHLQFPFCFYDQTYTAFVIGTNGLITFDTSNSLRCNGWNLSASGSPVPIPAAGTGSCGSASTCSTPTGVIYPRASIMGVYHDIDIDFASANKKMEYRIEGSFPCRRAIISFNEIPFFNCQTALATSEIVLYEGTAIIEIYVKSKPICSTWNGGLAILGIQNWNQDQAVTPFGKNATQWTAQNEAYRFTPSGNTSRFKRVELYKNGILISTGTTVSDGSGNLDVSFSNVCQPENSSAYTVKAYYKICTDTTQETELSGNLIVNKTAGPITVNTTNGNCITGNGTITVTNPVGPTYEYSLDSVTWQASNVFAKPPGTYTVYARIISTTCVSSTSAIIASSSNLTATATTTNAGCAGAANGSITVTASGGTPPYTYSINNGVTYQTSNVFTGLIANSYTIIVKDAGGCTNTVRPVVGSGSNLSGTATSNNASCSGSASGSITITATGGASPYTYSINNGATYQASNVFNGLVAGTYTIIIKDASGCTSSFNQSVGSNAGVTGNAISTNASCAGSNTGSINVNVNTGVAPFTFSLDGGPSQTSNIFNNVASGIHTVLITDAGGCTFSFQQSVGANAGVTGSATVTNAGCPGSTTGSINVSANAGTAPFTYSLNGGPFQSSNIFNNLAAATYTVTIKDAGGCTFTLSATVNNNPLLSAALAVVEPSCFNTSTGSITVSASLGTAPYQYALNGGSYQNNNVFNNVAAGNYIVHSKDATGCIKDTAIIINQPALLTAIADTVASTCNANDGTITVTASGGTSPYQYSKDNGATYQSSNVFNVAPGTYNVVVKDSKGCIVNKSATITLIDAMFLDLGADKTICFGSSVSLTPSTNAGTNIFNWSPSASLSSATSSTPSANPNDTTKYYLTAHWGVCQRSDSVTINVLHKPVVSAGNDTIICDRTSAMLRGSASNLSGPVKYLWTPANELSKPGSDTTTATPTTTGAHTYTLEVDDLYGCNFKVFDDVVVTMNPRVPAFAGNDTIAAMDLPHQLFANGGVQYLWSPAGVLDDATKQNPVAILHNDTKFTLIVTDNGGCIGYDTVFIKVYKGPAYYIPNAFTPNGDGINDVFRAIPPGIVSTEYFRVFNRWGQMVFETHQYMTGWDGTYLGKKQPNGVYVWVIKGIDKFGKAIESKGTVVLIR